MKIISCLAFLFIGVCFLFCSVLIKKTTPNLSNALFVEKSIEALSAEIENYAKVKTRIDERCRIKVGAKGKIKLLGGNILVAGADGILEFDGKVICIGSGDIYCKPVECYELYQVLK